MEPSWRVVFNDDSEVVVEATWIIEAIVEACLQTRHSYTDAVRAAHLAYGGSNHGT